MNVISKRTLVLFYKKHPEAKTALEVWHSDAKKSIWSTPDDIKKIYSSASFLKLAKITVLFSISKVMILV